MTTTIVLAEARTRAIAVLHNPHFWIAICLILFVLGTMHSAHAADASGGGGAGLPWEGPLDKLKRSISGPVAFIVALLGIIATGATLIWGGEIGEFAKRMIYVVLVVCIIVFANTMLTGALFSGAVIPHGATLTAADVVSHASTADRGRF